MTVGSISRTAATQIFPFLAKKFTGRRKAIKDFTHLAPDYVFWIYPDGELHDAKDSHRKHTPKGHRHILKDEPDYGGFLRGRLASNYGPPLLVVYCRPEALVENIAVISQLLTGLECLPVPVELSTLVISDNADIYGTLADLYARVEPSSHNL